MELNRTARDALGIVGLGAAACAACCAGPILALLGGLSVAGIASTWLIGAFSLAIAAMAAAGFVVVRRQSRRRRQRGAGPAPVALLTKAEATR